MNDFTPYTGTDTSTDQGCDGLYEVLAEATERSRTVVLALIDGSRLNGVPVGFSPARTFQPPVSGAAVLIREESGQPLFVVRLAHVVYVRALTTRRD